jgi:dUTPase
MEIYKREDFEFEQVEELSGNDRGGGMGSTGLK